MVVHWQHFKKQLKDFKDNSQGIHVNRLVRKGQERSMLFGLNSSIFVLYFHFDFLRALRDNLPLFTANLEMTPLSNFLLPQMKGIHHLRLGP